jgi:uncharacterized protein (TIGR00730 family)
MKSLIKATKAYKNPEFMMSKEARELRILAEYIEPRSRLEKYNVEKAIVFFGSARLKSTIEAIKAVNEAKNDSDLKRANNMLKMARFYDEAVELSQKIINWSVSTHLTDQQYFICTGGGPGIMEAANKGAFLANPTRSIGLNISLPFEQFPNQFITPELNFEFHYFFTRKLWFMDLAEALIVFPGGFGTCDEFFEISTLIQTKKAKQIPVILYGKKFWTELINFDKFVESELISAEDLNLFNIADTVDEAFNFLIKGLK